MNEAIKKLTDAQERRPEPNRIQEHAIGDAPIINLPKPIKIEFPKFKGEDPSCWVYEANQFFNYYNTSKVLVASFHMDEEALV
jgi:hypothetical protein